MKTLAQITALAVIVIGPNSLAVTAAAAPKLRELPVSQLFTPAGALARLQTGATYEASKFPIALRLTPPTGDWTGAQWESGRLPAELAERKGIPDEGGPPHFGWVALGHGGTSPTSPPRGGITIMTAFAPTPSVAATVTGLRTRGHGATYQSTLPVKVAGFSGVQFDGQRILTAAHHIFVPFSPISHGGGAFPSKLDAYQVYGPVFRVIVLNVRGKTVVVFIDSVALTADEFPGFLEDADRILHTLRFPT
jgi:hypothetical protein